MSDNPENSSQPLGTLRIKDPTQVPDEPHPDLLYSHRSHMLPSLATLWARREIILTLAERDLRANYKQATLGFAWAILAPVATLFVMVLIFKRVKEFQVGDVPYVLLAYCGILPWQFFAASLSMGGNSLLANKALLAKVHFPRECFPLSELVEAAFSTVLASTVLVVLFVVHHYMPHVEMLWAPLLIVIELVFCAGVLLAASALLVHVRDLVQVLPIVVQIGMFATPVIWPFSKVPADLRLLYAFFNPLGPVIDDVRRTMLLGQNPTWGLLAVAAAGAITYLVVGYTIFKRLEADLADIA